MKNFTLLIAATMLFTVVKTNAQEDLTQECTIKYNLFKGDFNSKKYDDAYLKNIDLIEKRNADLRLKINGYEIQFPQMSPSSRTIQILLGTRYMESC